MLEAVVGSQRPQECLLERVLGRRPAQAPGEEAEDRVAVLGVEAFEGRNRRHGLHHPGPTPPAARM